jgi:hypothetical protein
MGKAQKGDGEGGMYISFNAIENSVIFFEEGELTANLL